MLIVLIYVDDIIVTGSSANVIHSFIHSLQKLFPMKDLGQLHYFLRIEVNPTSNGLHLSQSKYLKDVLRRANMLDANPLPSYMCPKIILSKCYGDPFNDPHFYCSIVGALQYATLTQPDITFSVNKVSQFMQSPTTTHWAAVKRILRFLNGTISHGITLQPANLLSFQAYSDADWAGSPDDRKSKIGFCVFLGANIISWGSKKQPTVARSSTETEYKSLAVTSSELT